jgi:uncharacterized protein (DUF2267 family)
MSVTGLEVFDTTVHRTNSWLKELMEELHWENRQRAYDALRAVLHALRDRLTVEETAHLGAQLPMLVRGFYYEGWNPTGKPVKARSREQFLARVGEELRHIEDLDPPRAATAVFAVLERRVSEGEIEDVKQMLPAEIRELWPAVSGQRV